MMMIRFLNESLQVLYVYQAAIIMNRVLVKNEFLSLTDKLLATRSSLSQQIRRQTKSIVFVERRLRKMKKSVIALRKQKQQVGNNLNRISTIRNALSYVTNEPRQSMVEWESDDGVDTDDLSSESDTESETEKVNYIGVCFSIFWIHCH